MNCLREAVLPDHDSDDDAKNVAHLLPSILLGDKRKGRGTFPSLISLRTLERLLSLVILVVRLGLVLRGDVLAIDADLVGELLEGFLAGLEGGHELAEEHDLEELLATIHLSLRHGVGLGLEVDVGAKRVRAHLAVVREADSLLGLLVEEPEVPHSRSFQLLLGVAELRTDALHFAPLGILAILDLLGLRLVRLAVLGTQSLVRFLAGLGLVDGGEDVLGDVDDRAAFAERQSQHVAGGLVLGVLHGLGLGMIGTAVRDAGRRIGDRELGIGSGGLGFGGGLLCDELAGGLAGGGGDGVLHGVALFQKPSVPGSEFRY